MTEIHSASLGLGSSGAAGSAAPLTNYNGAQREQLNGSSSSASHHTPDSSDQRIAPLPARSRNDNSQDPRGAMSSGPLPNRPRAPAPQLARRVTSMGPAASPAADASTDSVREVELQDMSAGQVARTGQEEVPTKLSNLNEQSGALTQSMCEADRIHNRLKAELKKSSFTFLTDAQIAKIDEFQRCLAVMQAQRHELDQLRATPNDFVASEQAEPARSRSWAEWLKSDPVQKAVAAVEVGVAMLFKLGAWYGVEAILPAKADAFETTAKTVALVAQRVGVSLLLAGIGEYVPGTDGPRRWVNAGGDLKTIQGIGQAIDQGMTLAGLFGTNAASMQAPPSAGQIAGFGLVGLGGMLQTGALNKPILDAIDYLRGGNDSSEGAIEFIDTDALREARERQQAQGQPPQGEAQGSDLEQGPGQVRHGPRGEATADDLIGDLLDQLVPNMQLEIQRTFDSISGLHKALSPQAGSVQEAEEAAGLDAIREVPRDVLVQSMPRLDANAQIEQFKRDIAALRTAALDVRDSLPPNDDLRAQIDLVFQDAKKMEEAVTEASKNLTPHETAFLFGMTALGATGLLLTFIGPPTGNEWLSNVNNRAAIAGLTSSIGQNLANLGQFMGGAKPGDGRWKRFLKIGLDNANDNQVVKFAKDWGRNIRFLPIEFVPLTISTTLAEMGSRLKGQIAEAPLKAVPSVTTDRLMMETLRMALSNAFIVFRLGHRLEWNHYAGMASTFAGAAVAVGTELRK